MNEGTDRRRRDHLARGPLYRTSVDCRRFYRDGYPVLAEYGNLGCVDAHTDWNARPFAKGRVWGDTVSAFAKAPYAPPRRTRH